MGMQDFRGSMKQVFQPVNLAMIVIFGLFFAQLIMHVLSVWFDVDTHNFMAGPYIILFLALGGVYLAIALVRRSWATDLTKPVIAMLIVAAIIVTFILIKFKAATEGTLFAESAHAARAMLGLGG